MSKLEQPVPGLLLGSFLYRKDHHQKDKLIELWRERYGDYDEIKLSECPMKRYYSKEMGDPELIDRFILLSNYLVEREEMVKAKLWSTDIEGSEPRMLNLDVGILSLENLQLATGKNYSHRVYIQQGIYSDLTLIFQNKSYRTFPWTYPDYGSEECVGQLNLARKKLHLLLTEAKRL